MLFGLSLFGIAGYVGYTQVLKTNQVYTPVSVNNYSNTSNNLILSGNDRQDMLLYLNATRKQHGLNELRWDSSLYNVAQYWANECVKYNIVEHNFNGSSPSIRAFQYGITGPGTIIEVMSKTYSAQKAMINFMNSPSHRQGCLTSGLSKAGVGVSNTQDGMKLFVIDMM
ncbi:MAG TPA: CAP domain-containing protein [bacterium]|nr:CAP domain-containing protein [bacterium]